VIRAISLLVILRRVRLKSVEDEDKVWVEGGRSGGIALWLLTRRMLEVGWGRACGLLDAGGCGSEWGVVLSV
jgi:hypothetical protein